MYIYNVYYQHKLPLFSKLKSLLGCRCGDLQNKKNGSAWLQNVAKPMVALTPSDSPVMFEYIFPIPPLKAGVCGPQNNSGSNML